SIGYNRNFTIGVWVGNFNGIGTPELTGANIATPLLFQIFNAVDHNQNSQWFAPPKSIDYREVCSESGLIPEDFCTDLIIDAYIPGISSNQRCQHLKEIFVDTKETKSYCRACKPDKNVIRKLYRNLPMEVITFYEEMNMPYAKIPPHNDECTRIFSQNAPSITSLSDGHEYILISGENQKLMLKANTENSVKKVWWYVNDKLLTTALANEKVFFKPTEGHMKISCTDDKGRNSDIWIFVKYI
ncbi:MAG: penicillin-binding protein 1C, partial [Clostridia bacterium]|nr:penicillin-binding protein 1C [Clostridia bacterium]